MHLKTLSAKRCILITRRSKDLCHKNTQNFGISIEMYTRNLYKSILEAETGSLYRLPPGHCQPKPWTLSFFLPRSVTHVVPHLSS